MDIGLLDQDALSSPSTFHPNLEIMKLSTYYKKSKNFVSFILNLDNIDRYTKIVLRKDIDDENYLSNILLDKRCNYGGLAFTNNIYSPLDISIENSVPDFSIYNSYFNKILIKEKSYETLRKKYSRGSFVRLSTNGKDCNLDISKGILNGARRGYDIYVYDNDVFKIKNYKEAISSIVRGAAQKVLFIHPQSSSSFNQIEELCLCPWCGTKNEIIYDKMIYNKEFKEICSKSNNFFVKPLILICYDKNRTYTENFLKTDFKNSLNKMLYIMITKSKINLKCKEDIKDENFKKLYKNLISWGTQGFCSYSFNNFLLKRNKKQVAFLKTLTDNDSNLRELVNVIPKKISDKGGRWLL